MSNQHSRMPYVRYASIYDAFEAHVSVRDLDQCWPWIGSLSPSGYGQLTHRSRHYWAHQLAYRILIGPITHRDVGHTCAYNACCNPTHLFNAPHDQAVRNSMEWPYRSAEAIAQRETEREVLHQQLKDYNTVLRARELQERAELKTKAQAERARPMLSPEKRKQQQREKRRAYYQRPDIVAKKRAFRKAYYQTTRGKQAVAKWRQAYLKTPKGKVALEQKRRAARAYNRTTKGRERLRRSNHRRRLRKFKAQLQETVLVSQWEIKWRKKRWVRCYWCKEKFRPRDCHTDHIKALALGGAHILANVCISCRPCNWAKRALPLEKWNETLNQWLLF